MNSEIAIIAGLILVSLISMREIATHCGGLAKVKQPFWVLHIWSFGCGLGAFHHFFIYGKYRYKFADDTVSLAIYLFLVLIWYLNIRISFPKIAQTSDLKNYYFRRKHAFMGIWMIILVLSFVATSLIMDEGIFKSKKHFSTVIRDYCLHFVFRECAKYPSQNGASRWINCAEPHPVYCLYVDICLNQRRLMPNTGQF